MEGKGKVLVTFMLLTREKSLNCVMWTKRESHRGERIENQRSVLSEKTPRRDEVFFIVIVATIMAQIGSNRLDSGQPNVALAEQSRLGSIKPRGEWVGLEVSSSNPNPNPSPNLKLELNNGKTLRP